MSINGGFFAYVWVSLLFGIVNVFIGTILRIVTLPLTLLTFGLFLIIVNAILLEITDWLTNDLTIDNVLLDRDLGRDHHGADDADPRLQLPRAAALAPLGNGHAHALHAVVGVAAQVPRRVGGLHVARLVAGTTRELVLARLRLPSSASRARPTGRQSCSMRASSHVAPSAETSTRRPARSPTRHVPRRDRPGRRAARASGIGDPGRRPSARAVASASPARPPRPRSRGTGSPWHLVALEGLVDDLMRPATSRSSCRTSPGRAGGAGSRAVAAAAAVHLVGEQHVAQGFGRVRLRW